MTSQDDWAAKEWGECMAELKACKDLALTTKQYAQVAETQAYNAVHCDDEHAAGRRMQGGWMVGAQEATRATYREAADALSHVMELVGRMLAFEEIHIKERRRIGLPAGIEFECDCGHRAQDHVGYAGVDSMGIPRFIGRATTMDKEEATGCQAEVKATETEAAHACPCSHYRHRTSYLKEEEKEKEGELGA